MFFSSYSASAALYSAHSVFLAAYELSWSVNSRRLHVEGNFINQSKNVVTGEHAGANRVARATSILDTVISAGEFTTLTDAIKAARLTVTLADEGPFTVFAPSDQAFKKLPAGAVDALLQDSAKLKAVLNYHIIAGHGTTADLKSGDVMTLQGSALTAVVSGSKIQVNGAHVKRADMVATNGIVHEIDTVIMPKHWRLLATAA
jgi:uncharacterized surface protein with fasciclin (FAS1) repeats